MNQQEVRINSLERKAMNKNIKIYGVEEQTAENEQHLEKR